VTLLVRGELHDARVIGCGTGAMEDGDVECLRAVRSKAYRWEAE
jgi:hypothetical protein